MVYWYHLIAGRWQLKTNQLGVGSIVVELNERLVNDFTQWLVFDRLSSVFCPPYSNRMSSNCKYPSFFVKWIEYAAASIRMSFSPI